MSITLKRHRAKNPQRCQRCTRGVVDAEWNLKPEGETTMYLCDTHARWWAAHYGETTFPGDKEAGQ